VTESPSATEPDRSRSPERLHQRIQLVTAPTWILTIVLLGAMAGALLWSIFGSVLVQVAGRGLLVSAENRQIPVFTIEQARLMKTHVSAGEAVRSGQLLFELDQPALDLKLELAKTHLTELQNVLKVISGNAASIIDKQSKVADDHLAALDKQNKQLQEQVDFFSERVSELEGFLNRGLTTADKVEAARERLDAAILQLAQAQAQRAQVESNLLQANVSWERQKMDAQIAVENQQATVAEIKERVDQASQVVAPADGYVSEILVTEGQRIAPGTELAVIGTSAPGYVALVFFSPLDGQRIQPGMTVEIVPTTVKREEYGTMQGEVGSVSPRPISTEEVATLLGNDTLAGYLTSDEPPVFARVKVATVPGNPERFLWRTGSGPPFPVTSGTVVDAEVTVQEQAPISLVLPYLKTLVGL
jgi:HlyD family secretion protein